MHLAPIADPGMQVAHGDPRSWRDDDRRRIARWISPLGIPWGKTSVVRRSVHSAETRVMWGGVRLAEMWVASQGQLWRTERADAFIAVTPA